MGFRPSMPDCLPVIGPSRASQSVIYAFGHGHLGLTQSAATAKLVTQLVSGTETAISVDPFRAGRFS
jgi:D-amino-acid dehydrogenase